MLRRCPLAALRAGAVPHAQLQPLCRQGQVGEPVQVLLHKRGGREGVMDSTTAGAQPGRRCGWQQPGGGRAPGSQAQPRNASPLAAAAAAWRTHLAVQQVKQQQVILVARLWVRQHVVRLLHPQKVPGGLWAAARPVGVQPQAQPPVRLGNLPGRGLRAWRCGRGEVALFGAALAVRGCTPPGSGALYQAMPSGSHGLPAGQSGLAPHCRSEVSPLAPQLAAAARACCCTAAPDTPRGNR